MADNRVHWATAGTVANGMAEWHCAVCNARGVHYATLTDAEAGAKYHTAQPNTHEQQYRR